MGIDEAAVKRMRAVVEATGLRPSGDLEELCRQYLSLRELAESVLVVVRGGDGRVEPLELLCLEPMGDVEEAEELGLMLRLGRSRCLVYPGPSLARRVGCGDVG